MKTRILLRRIFPALLVLSAVAVPCRAQFYPVDPFLNGYPYSIDFANDSVGVITEEFGYYRTTDRGETWEFTWFDEKSQAVGSEVQRRGPGIHAA